MKILNSCSNKNICTIIQAAFFLMLLLMAYNSYGKVISPPYLQAVTTNTIVISFESDSRSEKFSYEFTKGTKGSKTPLHIIEATTSTDSTFVHKIRFTDLTATQEFGLNFKIANETYPLSFKTATNKSVPFRVAVMGDSRSGVSFFKKICKGMEASKPDFAIFLGDLAYKPDYQYWRNEFFIPEFFSFAQKVPFVNATGNHEKWHQNTKAFMSSPDNVMNSPFYSFDYGDAHFLILNTEVNVSKNSEQWKYALKDLENSKKKWKIVSFHIPAYCAGAHNENAKMKAMTSEIFEKTEVDLVLTGHSHFYQRNYVNGIYHIVSGGGGSPLYKPETKEYVQKSAKEYHYLVMDLNKDAIKIEAINDNGVSIDKFEIKK